METCSVGFIGAGRTGTALATELTHAGYSVAAIASRTFDHAEILADRLPDAVTCRSLQDVADRCDIVFLTVPDDAIESVCASIHWHPSTSVIHCSGAHSLDLLKHAGEGGTSMGAFHPMQTLATLTPQADVFRDVSFAIEASTDALKKLLSQMALDLGGTSIEIKGSDKPLYHASAAMASNYLVTLLEAASDIWRSIGSTRSSGLQALLPLVRGTIDNLEAVGFPDALTGPIARGDVDTVRIHLQALSDTQPQLVQLYLTMGKKTIDLALEKGGVRAEDAAAMHALFDSANKEDEEPES